MAWYTDTVRRHTELRKENGIEGNCGCESCEASRKATAAAKKAHRTRQRRAGKPKPVTLAEKRAAAVEERLAAWERRLKAAVNKVQVLRRKQRYYAKRVYEEKLAAYRPADGKTVRLIELE